MINRVLLLLVVLAGCSDEGTGEVRTDLVPGQQRYCFRNELKANEVQSPPDVQQLTVEIDGDRASGIYNWLPAYKDRRLGSFEGTVQDGVVTAMYEFQQEGLSNTAVISIVLEKSRAIVSGGAPELGLDATIAVANCP